MRYLVYLINLCDDLFDARTIGYFSFVGGFWGSGCYVLSIPFYKHVVYTILIGVFGGYVGVPILDKIVEKLGLQKKGA